MPDTPTKRTPVTWGILAASFATILLVGFVDKVTGPYLALSVFYAAPVFAAAFVGGRVVGRLAAATAAVTALVADLTTHGHLPFPYPYWNAAVRLALFLAVAEVMGRLGEALHREQLVAQREREAAARLRALDQMKDSFLQSVAHDMQDPLSGILAASIALVRERDGSSGDTELLTRGIASMARKLARLVGEMLDAERVSRGIMDVSPRRTDVGELVRGLVDERVLDAYPVPVRVRARPAWASIDAAKVERAVDEVIRAAVLQASPGATIEVRVRPRSDGVLVNVDEVLDAVRERPVLPVVPRVQPSDATAEDDGKLAYAATIARLHGGRLWVRQGPAGGLAVGMFLPPEPGESVRADAASA